ncbi:hypothetical protein CLV35_1351 [Motilibacter peucedani]|uniref:Uncharacterized protein n=1 Tax=Motilibacter peucedani TaxID=598650 RepID=A0A420XS74_9ACTN|nr:hypothetical protein [Motilibacter peucedani]RKS77657.1 hypothetical protein CLV35_1351 [Motilibacter peucedani]
MTGRSALVLHWCADCREVRAFETPHCEDHVECPELACIECGTAVLLGSLLDADLAYGVGAPGAAAARSWSSARTA